MPTVLGGNLGHHPTWIPEKDICDRIWSDKNFLISMCGVPIMDRVIILREKEINDKYERPDFIAVFNTPQRIEIFLIEIKITATIHSAAQLFAYKRSLYSCFGGKEAEIKLILAARWFDGQLEPFGHEIEFLRLDLDSGGILDWQREEIGVCPGMNEDFMNQLDSFARGVECH